MTDEAPRWLVRWLKTTGLLLVIALLGYVIYQELTLPARMEAELHEMNCRTARQIALMQDDPRKAAHLAATAAIVCLP